MFSQTRLPQRAAGIGFILLAIAGCAWETAVATSQFLRRPQTPQALARAAALTPLDADLWRQLGILSLDADPGAARRYLERAAALDPFDANARIGLGLLAESSHQLSQAENDFLAAARLSRRLKAKWALAFFYARNGAPDRFWPAAAIAANVPRAGIQPVFQLAASLERDPARVAALLRLETQFARAEYLAFLLSRPGADGLAGIALELQPAAPIQGLLMAACERLIQAGRGPEAVQVWNLIARAVPPRLTPLSPSQGISLTNPRFEISGSRGFNWHPVANPGITLTRHPEGLQAGFSGLQADDCLVLEQFVPVIASRDYQMAFVYRTPEAEGRTGLEWRISPPGAAAIASLDFDAASKGSSSIRFRTPPSDLLHLALRYHRPHGSVRFEGAVTLISMSLKLL